MRAIPARPRGTARLARSLGLDGNPLRRASDRAEAWIRIGVLAAFLVAGPQAATGAVHLVHHCGITGQTVPVTALTLVLVALALLTVLRLIRRLLDRRRLAAWDAAWSTIGPHWTGRAPGCGRGDSEC